MTFVGSRMVMVVDDARECAAIQRLKAVGLQAEWSTARKSFWHTN